MRTLNDAIACFRETMARYPERDGLAAEAAVVAGTRHPHPVLYLHHLHSPEDTTTSPPHYQPPTGEFRDSAEGKLASEILRLLAPLDMLNPVAAVLSGGGRTVADMLPSFSVPLGVDDQGPAQTRPVRELLALPPPDPDASGWMPAFRERIRQVRDLTPPEFKIGMPNLQGPFNLLQAMAADDAFLAATEEPDVYHAYMDRITTFWIAAAERLMGWIGPERLRPLDRWILIVECSANMVSTEFYLEHILPYDRRIARHFGGIRLHPCSGRHVFHTTLKNLPGVRATEAGLMLSKMAHGRVFCLPAHRLGRIDLHPRVRRPDHQPSGDFAQFSQLASLRTSALKAQENSKCRFFIGV